MGRLRISRFLLASIFLILFLLLIVVYFSDNPNIGVNEEAEEATIKELNENIREYIGKKVLITGTITSSEGDDMVIADEGGEFRVTNPNLVLKKGTKYEIEGIVKSSPAFYYRYYKIDYYLDVNSTKEI